MKNQALIAVAFLAVACSFATAKPSKQELAALLTDPTSDWLVIFPYSEKELVMPKGIHFTAEQGELINKQSEELDIMRELADIDALTYFKGHPQPKENLDAMAIGKATAFRHNLIGGSANAYAAFFGRSVDALYTK
jgi:hypothetical protein